MASALFVRTASGWAIIVAALWAGGCGDGTQLDKLRDSAPVMPANSTEDILVHCLADCADAIASVRSLRGNVVSRFRNVPGFAARLPAGQLLALSRLPGIANAEKNFTHNAPNPALRFDLGPSKVSARPPVTNPTSAQPADRFPTSFSLDSVLTGASQLHDDGIVGADVVIAVIDSGVANSADLVPSLAGSVIGGESFVDAPGEPSSTSTLNDDHGTWVAAMIAGHGVISLPEGSDLARAIAKYQPESISVQADGTSLVPMTGSAPEAQIYSLKIFGVDEPGAPRSRTLAALDRVLTLKRNFMQGQSATPVSGDGSEEDPYVYDALDVQIVNVSLGGPALFAGGSLEDELISEMLSEGIVVVAAAGNEGFAAMTGGSPGATIAALNVGAANVANNERILRELQVGPDGGVAFRPTDHAQVAEFSSRGPTADGRSDPDLIANGFAVFVQGADGGLALVSGTSFAAPTVAGAAALLFQASPRASAVAVRAALIESANAALIGGNPSANDQGNGFLDVPAAAKLLASPEFSPRSPALPERSRRPVSVAETLERAGLNVLELGDDDGRFEASVKLMPGEVVQFLIETPSDASALSVTLSDIQPDLPTDQQNSLFGDDIGLVVVDAPFSYNEVLVQEYLTNDRTFILKPLQTGIIRAALQGDWTNAGDVSATLSLALERERLPLTSFRGRLADDQTSSHAFRVTDDTTLLNVELAWRGNWAVNPAHDIDLAAVDPAGNVILDGATLASPERISVADPLPGTWTLLIDGFMLHGFDDRYTLRVTDQDDRVLIRDD